MKAADGQEMGAEYSRQAPLLARAAALVAQLPGQAPAEPEPREEVWQRGHELLRPILLSSHFSPQFVEEVKLGGCGVYEHRLE